MNSEKQIETLATLVENVKHLAEAVREMRATVGTLSITIGGLVQRPELSNYVQRTEFEALKSIVDKASPRSFMKLLTELSLGLAAMAAAGGIVVSAVLYFSARHP